MIDYCINKLQELLIKQKFKDKKYGISYIKKVDAYLDLINLLKDIKNLKESDNDELLEQKNKE